MAGEGLEEIAKKCEDSGLKLLGLGDSPASESCEDPVCTALQDCDHVRPRILQTP